MISEDSKNGQITAFTGLILIFASWWVELFNKYWTNGLSWGQMSSDKRQTMQNDHTQMEDPYNNYWNTSTNVMYLVEFICGIVGWFLFIVGGVINFSN